MGMDERATDGGEGGTDADAGATGPSASASASAEGADPFPERGPERGPGQEGSGITLPPGSDDDLLGEVRAHLARETREAGRSVYYTKSKRVGDAVGVSTNEAAVRMATLEAEADGDSPAYEHGGGGERAPAVVVSRWGTSTPATWEVRPA